MAKTMIASAETISDGQIENVVEKVRAALRKHRGQIPKEAVQAVLGEDNIGMQMIVSFRERVEAVSKMVVRVVEVDYDVSPQEAISATGRVEYLNGEVVSNMPRNSRGKKKVEVCFFPLEKFTCVADFQKMLADRGLEPDPYALAAVNKEDSSFADNHPNGTQWVDCNGKHCCLAFSRWSGGRSVGCDRRENDWSDYWWVGGVRKQSSDS